MKIREAIDAICRREGITQRDLSTKLGTCPEQLSRWRNGKSFPRHDALRRLERLADTKVTPNDYVEE